MFIEESGGLPLSVLFRPLRSASVRFVIFLVLVLLTKHFDRFSVSYAAFFSDACLKHALLLVLDGVWVFRHIN